MANKIYIDVTVDDKGTTRRVAVDAKKLGDSLDKTAGAAAKADRVLKGVGAQSSNTTKNFSKMSQNISGGLVPAYATLAANVFAVSAAFNYLRSAGQLKQLEQGQIAYSSATGKGMISLTKALVSATDAQLNYQDAAQAGAIGVASGLSVVQVTALGKAAKDTSAVLGRDLTDSFNRLVRGITKAEPELLDELGIILRLETATQNYIRTMGIQGRTLTTAEKTQAVYLETITQVNDKYGQLEDQIDPNPWQVLAVQLDRVNRQLKSALTEYLAPLALWFSKNMVVMGIVFLPLIKSITSAMIPGISRLGDGLETISNKFKTMAEAATAAKVASIAALTPETAKLQAAAALAAANVVPTGGVAATVAAGKTLTGKQISSQLNQIKQIEAGSVSKALSKDLVLLRANKKAWEDYKISLLKMAEATYTSDAALQKVRAQLLGVGIAATTTARGFNIAAIAARGFAVALSALNWIFIIASVGALVYSLFQARNVTEELTSEQAKNAEAAARFRDATSSLAEEFKSFNETQERLLSRSGDVISYFSNLSNRILTVGSALNQIDGSRLRAILPKELEEFISQSQKASVSFLDTLNARLADAISSDLAAYGGGIATISVLDDLNNKAKETALNTRLVDAAVQEGAPESVKALADIAKQYADIAEGVNNLPEGISRSAPAVVTLTEATKKLSDLTLGQLRATPSLVFDLIADIQKAEQGVQRLALKTQGFIASRNEFIRTEADVIRSVFNPITALEGQLNTVKELLIQNTNLRDDLLLDTAKLAEVGGTNFFEGLEKDIQRAKELSKILTTLTSAEREANIATERSRVNAERDVIGRTSEVTQVRMTQASLEQAKIEEAKLQTLYETKTLQNQILLLTGETLEGSRVVEQENARLAVESARIKIEGLERQIDLTKQLYDTANQALESGLTTNIAAIIKGEESSIKEAMLSIARGMLTSVADTLATQLTNMIMKTDPMSKGIQMGQAAGAQIAAAMEAAAYKVANIIGGSLESPGVAGIGAENKKTPGPVSRLGDYLFGKKKEVAVTAENPETGELQRSSQGSARVGGIFTPFLTSLKGLFSPDTPFLTKMKDLFVGGLEGFTGIFKGVGGLLGSLVQGGLGSLFKFLPFANGGMAMGGFRTAAYSSGGLATKPTIGLVGEGKYNEAIVPLPNGKSIPVQMQGAAGSQNNVTVNVAIDGNGNANTNMQQDSPQAGNLGALIARAVQQELQNQKRSGGILNPYGAA